MDREDVLQVARLVVVEKKPQVAQCVAEGAGSRLFGLVFKACMMYGHKEKAARIGYRVEDLFFYSLPTLRYTIPVVLEGWSKNDSFEFEYDTENRATLMDVREALTRLSASDYQIICWAFQGDPDREAGYETVGKKLGINPAAARGRVNRILRSMQESLGGESPYPRRKSKTNAAALAEIRSVWDGNG